jgi:hypothetical protein
MEPKDELSTETRMALLQQERQAALNTREVMTIRHRVHKRLGNQEGMDATTKELEKCETILDELDKMFQELQQLNVTQ